MRGKSDHRAREAVGKKCPWQQGGESENGVRSAVGGHGCHSRKNDGIDEQQQNRVQYRPEVTEYRLLVTHADPVKRQRIDQIAALREPGKMLTQSLQGK